MIDNKLETSYVKVSVNDGSYQSTADLEGVICRDLGEQTATNLRREKATVYGRDGFLQTSDGAYDGASRTLTFFAPTIALKDKLVALFAKAMADSSRFIFSDDPNGYYVRGSVQSIKSAVVKYPAYEVVVVVDLQPFRREMQAPVTVNASDSMKTYTNGSLFPCMPVLSLTGSGVCSLTIGKEIMRLNLGVTAQTVDIDCQTIDVFKSGTKERLNSVRLSGPFFRIQPGANGIAFSGNITRLVIKSEWRYL